jgi:hypothetical protein
MAIPVAYPFIEVNISPPPAPVAQRSPGVVAVVGRSNAGEADANQPEPVFSGDEAVEKFASRDNQGAVVPTELYTSLLLALGQRPRPSKIYGVKVDGDNFAAALAGLNGADDVNFVSLANVPAPSAVLAGNALRDHPVTALKAHVEGNSDDGQPRIGVIMADPAFPRTAPQGQQGSYVDRLKAVLEPFKSSKSRMVAVAARQPSGDLATAAMAAIAGYPPHVSLVLKPIRDVTIPLWEQYGASEIVGLSDANIIPIIDPVLITGTSVHFAEGRTFTSDTELLHVDLVRTIDDIEFRLRAGLIGLIGDARITKSGLTTLRLQMEGILGPLKRAAVIDEFSIGIPLLDILGMPRENWTPTEVNLVETARGSRVVEAYVHIVYGPAIHRLRITLNMDFK